MGFIKERKIGGAYSSLLSLIWSGSPKLELLISEMFGLSLTPNCIGTDGCCNVGFGMVKFALMPKDNALGLEGQTSSVAACVARAVWLTFMNDFERTVSFLCGEPNWPPLKLSHADLKSKHPHPKRGVITVWRDNFHLAEVVSKADDF